MQFTLFCIVRSSLCYSYYTPILLKLVCVFMNENMKDYFACFNRFLFLQNFRRINFNLKFNFTIIIIRERNFYTNIKNFNIEKYYYNNSITYIIISTLLHKYYTSFVFSLEEIKVEMFQQFVILLLNLCYLYHIYFKNNSKYIILYVI